MKYKDAVKLTPDELKRLPESELIEALEDYMEQEHTITFDDSNVKI